MAVETDLPSETPEGVQRLFVTQNRARRANDATTLIDSSGLVAERYGAGMTYLVRPDQHIAARFPAATGGQIMEAFFRATGRY